MNGDDRGMRLLQAGRKRRGIGRAGTMGGVSGALLVVASCGSPRATPDLNEFGIPVDPTNNMVQPVLLGLVVATLLLVAAAYVVWRLGRQKDALPKPGRPDAWWTCGSCGTLNTGDRDSCFSCHAARSSDPPIAPPGTIPPT